MNTRLYRSTESGLATLRRKAFRHVHDLSVLTQNSERKGALVSRVTSDVDQISTFMQWGGILLIVSTGQLAIATVLMAVYSWQLTLLVWVCFLPLLFGVRWLQRLLSKAYLKVRERTGEMLGVIGETVVGAAVIRAYGTEERTARRIDRTVLATRNAQVKAQRLSMAVSPLAELVSAFTYAVVIAVGIWLGVIGSLTAGQLVAFLFLINLFVAPMTWPRRSSTRRRTRSPDGEGLAPPTPTPTSPTPALRHPLPRGPSRSASTTSRLPRRPPRARRHHVEIAPGSRVASSARPVRKTTFVKLLTRLMDPDEGKILLNGVNLREVAFSSLRSRVVLVPQEGFLFDSTLADNIRFARPEATDEQITEAITQLGLSDWLAGLPHGLATPVGQRGESLSAERSRCPDPGLHFRPRSAHPGRGHLVGRPGHGGPHPARPGPPHPGPHFGGDRAPAVHRGGRRRSAGLRPRPDRPARHPRRTGRPSRRVRGLARLLGAQLRVSSLRSRLDQASRSPSTSAGPAVQRPAGSRGTSGSFSPGLRLSAALTSPLARLRLQSSQISEPPVNRDPVNRGTVVLGRECGRRATAISDLGDPPPRRAPTATRLGQSALVPRVLGRPRNALASGHPGRGALHRSVTGSRGAAPPVSHPGSDGIARPPAIT